MAEAREHTKNSSTNTDSDRVLVTKRAIFQALRELMEEQDFAKISAGQIMERAGVSRSTFYRCFSDKYDIVNWSFKRYKNIRLQETDQYFAFETALPALLRHLQDHQAYFAAALRYRGQNSLRDYFFETNEEYLRQCWTEEHGPGSIDADALLNLQFAAAGMSKVVELWVLNGCKEDLDDVARIIESNIPAFIRATLF